MKGREKLLLILITVLSNDVSSVKVRIGHIGAIGYMKNGEKVLDISRKELWKDRVLDEDFDLECPSPAASTGADRGIILLESEANVCIVGNTGLDDVLRHPGNQCCSSSSRQTPSRPVP
uniref:Uncharacterized protein n=1 Tax=Heterorhabditis bacteriophora TaxID=37862 RepID=A0A1I7WIY1_HETBA